MFTTRHTNPRRVLGLAAAVAALFMGAATVAAAGAPSASTEPSPTTEPVGTADPGMTDDSGMTDHSAMDNTAAGSIPPGADGSADASSPEAEAFCAAELAAEAASGSEDPAVIEPAFEAVVAAAPAEIAPAVEEVIANAESGPGDPAFDEPYAQVIEYMRGNCGYAELNLVASDYEFGGLSPEVTAGPTIISMENIGEEVHEIALFRFNDDVTMTAEELLALPEEEAFANVTPAGFAFVFPGAVGNTVVDFTAGRYVALCFLPEGALPEVMAQMEGPESTTPPGVELGPPHFTLGMLHEFQVA